MAISLYDATVRSFQQIVASTAAILEKGAAHCRQAGADPDDLVEARIFPDMAPLRFQIVSVDAHSRGAIEALRSGSFSPSGSKIAYDYAGLQTLLGETQTFLQSVSAKEVDGALDRDISLKVGDRTIPFEGDDFLLTFSVPNFYFHATTAYDILRLNGIPIGKRDYLGQMRIKQG